MFYKQLCDYIIYSFSNKVILFLQIFLNHNSQSVRARELNLPNSRLNQIKIMYWKNLEGSLYAWLFVWLVVCLSRSHHGNGHSGDDGWLTMEDGWLTMEDGWWMINEGWWMMDDGMYRVFDLPCRPQISQCSRFQKKKKNRVLNWPPSEMTKGRV